MSDFVPKGPADLNDAPGEGPATLRAAASTPDLPGTTAPPPGPDAPPAGRSRIGWADLPESVRSAVECLMDSPVMAAHSQPGGYSPGSADRVVTAKGSRFFVKAVSSSLNPESPQLHRREARIMTLLPAGLPIPRLVGTHDDGEWVALVFTDVDGRHPQLSGADLHAVLDAVDAISARSLPPQALEVLPSLTEEVREIFAGL
ncbi:hypothetical protein AB4Y67_13240 [Arthrobacter sp. YAF17]|uniref:hypothetical protein n=1 Tax=Arthrobacter sp. YAF17 TaxID=3233077 RepID=UPI003F909CEE